MSSSPPSIPAPDTNPPPAAEVVPALPAELAARYRAEFFAHVKALADHADDERVRLAASLGGLKALAQLDTLAQRERLLDLRAQRLALAREHLDLLELRESKRPTAPAAQAPAPARQTTAPADSSESTPEPEPAAPDRNAPLRTDEIEQIIKLNPGIPASVLFKAKSRAHWRGILNSQRYWSGYWAGHAQAGREARGDRRPYDFKPDVREAFDPQWPPEPSDLDNPTPADVNARAIIDPEVHPYARSIACIGTPSTGDSPGPVTPPSDDPPPPSPRPP